jgi:NADH-quinone oxidoreductase subunit N
VYNNEISFKEVYQNTFIFDILSTQVKEITLISSIICLLLFEESLLKLKINNFEYSLLLLGAILGLMFLVSSYDLLSLYLAIEMQSLCLYVLAAAKKDSTFSTEAGLKYFILGSFSSALLLFGISILYGCTGTTNFHDLSLLFSADFGSDPLMASAIEKGILFIAAAFLFKIAAAPLHMWSPDVYEGSPISSTIFFAVIPKLALFTVFLRLFQGVLFSFQDILLYVLVLFSMASVVVGSFAALKQKKLKRLLAYSSISHVGYLLLAFAANSIEGTQALFFYLSIYMITSLTLWTFVLSIESTTNLNRSKTLVDLSNIVTANPLLALTGLLAFFSLAGVPPLAGFYAKMQVFVHTMGSSFFFASFFAILTSVISSYYYIRVIKNIYFEGLINKTSTDVFHYPVTRASSLMLGSGLLFLIFLFLNPTMLLLFTEKMALSLF